MCSINYFCWCYQWLHLPWWSNFIFSVLLFLTPFVYPSQSFSLSNYVYIFFDLADAIIQSDLQCIHVFNCFISSCIPLESNHELGVANATLYCLICINAIYMSVCLEKCFLQWTTILLYSSTIKNVLLYYIFKCNLFLCCKAEFSALLLQSSVSHDPSQTIIRYRFAAQETCCLIFCGNHDKLTFKSLG